MSSTLSSSSSNPVQNKIVKAALDGKGDIIVIDQNEYLNGPISSAHLSALKSGGKMLYVRIPAGEVGGSMYMSFMPCAYIYNTTALYISRLEPITAGTRLFMKLYDKDTGALKETYAVVLKSDGDGTKFLNDQGEYSVPPTQERGTVVFFSSGISSSVSGKGNRRTGKILRFVRRGLSSSSPPGRNCASSRSECGWCRAVSCRFRR